MMLCFLSSAMGQVNEEKKDFQYWENASIQYDAEKLNKQNLYEVISGNQRVFQFTTNNAGDLGNYSEAPTIITFETELGSNRFELRDDQIMHHGGIYLQDCRCQDKGIHKIERGVITGERTGPSEWTVAIDVFVEGRKTEKEYHITETGTFQEAQR
ncbi:MAG: hypothetical protein HQ500_00720 [Flavobacteriales bacterium]|nr:hypothetical protein [Flavobacteriales bacterium]